MSINLNFTTTFKCIGITLCLLWAGATEVKACNLKPQIGYTQLDTAFRFYMAAGTANSTITWDFGDGHTAAGKPHPQYVYHKYTQNGKYTVKMYYHDTMADCLDTAITEICFFVLDSLPKFKRSGDTLIITNNGCQTKTGYRWYFGDNTYAWGCNVRHRYTTPGFYYAQLLFITDSVTGCSYYEMPPPKMMDFTKCGFTANFNATPKRLKVQTGTSPIGNSTDRKAGRETWYWGDGSTSTIQKIQYSSIPHTYAIYGNYNICHVLQDSVTKCQDSVCKSVYIDSCNAISKFSYNVTGRTIKLTNESNIGTCQWYLDGVLKATNYTPEFTFKRNGIHTVCLRTFGSDECYKEICKEILVRVCEHPTAFYYNWSVDDCAEAKFFNYDSNYTEFLWKFEDGSTSSERTPKHKFQYGLHVVKVIASDSQFNCRDSFSFVVNNSCCNVKDSLVLNFAGGTANTASIDNFSYIRIPRGPVHKHLWVFGDGTTSTDASPSHTYTKSGRVDGWYVGFDTVHNCVDSIHFTFTIDASATPFVLNANYYKTFSGLRSVYTNLYFNVYPSPFNGRYLTLTGNTLETIQSVTLYDALGRVYGLSYTLENDRVELHTESELPAGIYLVYIKTIEGVAMLKLVKGL